MNEPKPDVFEVLARRDSWFRLHVRWGRIGKALSLLIAGLSAYVASGLSQEHGRDFAALIVAVCAALQATLGPDRRANSFREAWIELDLAVKRLSNIPPDLVDAIRRGENRIGNTHAERTPQEPGKKFQNDAPL